MRIIKVFENETYSRINGSINRFSIANRNILVGDESNISESDIKKYQVYSPIFKLFEQVIQIYLNRLFGK